MGKLSAQGYTDFINSNKHVIQFGGHPGYTTADKQSFGVFAQEAQAPNFPGGAWSVWVGCYRTMPITINRCGSELDLVNQLVRNPAVQTMVDQYQANPDVDPPTLRGYTDGKTRMTSRMDMTDAGTWPPRPRY